MMTKMMAWICMISGLLTLAGPAGAADGTQYQIGPGDVLDISVWKNESLSRQIVVPPDGVISFPLIGDIDVRHRTVADLRDLLAERLTEYVPGAPVAVILAQVNSLKAYVIGNVNRAGEFPIGINTTVMQILSMAGGLNPFASESRIHILRQENEATVRIPFNYSDVLKGSDLEQDIVLRRGDVVVVP